MNVNEEKYRQVPLSGRIHIREDLCCRCGTLRSGEALCGMAAVRLSNGRIMMTGAILIAVDGFVIYNDDIRDPDDAGCTAHGFPDNEIQNEKCPGFSIRVSCDNFNTDAGAAGKLCPCNSRNSHAGNDGRFHSTAYNGDNNEAFRRKAACSPLRYRTDRPSGRRIFQFLVRRDLLHLVRQL